MINKNEFPNYGGREVKNSGVLSTASVEIGQYINLRIISVYLIMEIWLQDYMIFFTKKYLILGRPKQSKHLLSFGTTSQELERMVVLSPLPQSDNVLGNKPPVLDSNITSKSALYHKFCV